MATEIRLGCCPFLQYSQKPLFAATAFHPNVFGSRSGLVKAAANICLPLPLVTLEAIHQTVCAVHLGHIMSRKLTLRGQRLTFRSFSPVHLAAPAIQIFIVAHRNVRVGGGRDSVIRPGVVRWHVMSSPSELGVVGA